MIKVQGRALPRWENGPRSGEIFANYTGSYRNWPTTTPDLNTGGVPAGGGDEVDGRELWDVHLA